MMPDPTALATLGIILFVGTQVRLSLLIVPLIWTAIRGATLYAMREPAALVLPIAGSLVLVFALRRRFATKSPRY